MDALLIKLSSAVALIGMCTLVVLKLVWLLILPSNFCSSLGLLSYRLLIPMVVAVEQFRRRLETRECSLSCCPLCLSLSLSIVIVC